MSDWMRYVPSIVFSRVKSDFSEKIKTSYGITDLNFSTQAQSNTSAKFPFVRMKTVKTDEALRTLDNSESNAGDFEFWWYISDNKTENRAMEIAYEVKRILKTMQFNISGPLSTDNTDVKEVLLKCDRKIGRGNPL